jgi:hypothetical protein
MVILTLSFQPLAAALFSVKDTLITEPGMSSHRTILFDLEPSSHPRYYIEKPEYYLVESGLPVR